MSIKDLISKATSEVARATERAAKAEAQVTKKLEQQFQKQAGRFSKLADMAVGHVDEATKLVTSSTALLNRVVPLLDGEVIQRGIGVLTAAAGKLVDSKVAAVKEAAGKLQGAVGGLQQKFQAVAGLAAKPAAQEVLSSLEPVPGAAEASGAAAAAASAAAATTAATPHLLMLSTKKGTLYHFGLSTAAFSTLKRQTSYGITAAARLNRKEAAHAVSEGGESLTVSGVVYAAAQRGGRELDKLRAIGNALEPLLLTTGYGEVLGHWYMTAITQDLDGLMADGAARKHTFTLEFKRYGDDYQNL